MIRDKLIDKLMNIVNTQMTSTKIQLDNPSTNQLRDSMMILVRNMRTRNVDSYFYKVIRHIDTPNIFIKSLMNCFMVNIEKNTSLLMLIINTTLKDLSDRDDFKIQGLRVATNIQNQHIQQFFIAKIQKLMSHRNEMVRLCAVIAYISVYRKKQKKFYEYKFDEILMKMMDDDVLCVRECVIFAISICNVNINLELLTANYEIKSDNELIAMLRILNIKVNDNRVDDKKVELAIESESTDIICVDGTRIKNSVATENHKNDDIEEKEIVNKKTVDNENNEHMKSKSNDNVHANDESVNETEMDNTTEKQESVENDMHDDCADNHENVFCISKQVEKLLLFCLRSENPVLVILSSYILIHIKIFHHLIFNSLIYFMNSIYSKYMLCFFLKSNLRYDSKSFMIYSDDRIEVKRLKLMILCDIMDNLAKEEIKRNFELFDNEILERLIINNHKNTDFIKKLIATGMKMENLDREDMTEYPNKKCKSE